MPYPAVSIERDFGYVPHHPAAEAYCLYNPPPHERPTWDLTSALYAVRPDRGYFDLSEPGHGDGGGGRFHPFHPCTRRPRPLPAAHREPGRRASRKPWSSSPASRRASEEVVAGNTVGKRGYWCRWLRDRYLHRRLLVLAQPPSRTGRLERFHRPRRFALPMLTAAPHGISAPSSRSLSAVTSPYAPRSTSPYHLRAREQCAYGGSTVLTARYMVR